MKAYDLHDIIFSQYSDFQTRSDVFETCRKMEMHFRDHERILISVSGGSDSIQLTLEGEIRKNG